MSACQEPPRAFPLTFTLGLHAIQAHLGSQPYNLSVQLAVSVDEQCWQVTVWVIRYALEISRVSSKNGFLQAGTSHLVSDNADEFCRWVLFCEKVQVACQKRTCLHAGRKVLSVWTCLRGSRSAHSPIFVEKADDASAFLVAVASCFCLLLARFSHFSRIVGSSNGVHSSETCPFPLLRNGRQSLFPQGNKLPLLIVCLSSHSILLERAIDVCQAGVSQSLFAFFCFRRWLGRGAPRGWLLRDDAPRSKLIMTIHEVTMSVLGHGTGSVRHLQLCVFVWIDLNLHALQWLL